VRQVVWQPAARAGEQRLGLDVGLGIQVASSASQGVQRLVHARDRAGIAVRAEQGFRGAPCLRERRPGVRGRPEEGGEPADIQAAAARAHQVVQLLDVMAQVRLAGQARGGGDHRRPWRRQALVPWRHDLPAEVSLVG
jgi:hypothetical protein